MRNRSLAQATQADALTAEAGVGMEMWTGGWMRELGAKGHFFDC